MKKFRLPTREGDAPETVARAARAVGATQGRDGNFYFKAKNLRAAQAKMTTARTTVALEEVAKTMARTRSRARRGTRGQGRGSQQVSLLEGAFRVVFGVPRKRRGKKRK